MKTNTIKIFLVLALLNQLIVHPLFAQYNRVTRVRFSSLVEIDSVASQLEKEDHIKLYYKPEWFKGKTFRKSVTELPLDECLNVIKRISKLSCYAINPTTYVFVPVEVHNYTNRVNRDGVLLIGESNDSVKNATATVEGKIVDFRTGKPLEGARLTIDNLNFNTVTDRRGNYKMTVPIGDYDLRINYVGYDEDDRRIRIFGSGIVDFEIAQKTIKLKEVLVTDQAADLNLIRTQMSTIHMNSKVIKELPEFMGEKDIIKSLTLLPGIQSTGEFGTGFFVRGGSADQNLILVEGVPLFNSSHLFGFSSAINSDAISSVTLLKAGIPANYGERASSVMDIQLKHNADKLAGKGGIGLLDSRLNLEVPLLNKKVSLFLSGRSSYSDWLLHAMPDADLKNSSASFYDLNGLLKINLSSKDNLILFGYYSNDQFSFTKGSPYQYDNILASAKYSHVFNESLYSTLLTGFSRYENNISSMDTLKPKEAYKITSSINYYKTNLNFTWNPFNDHSIDFGLNSVLYQLQQGNLYPYGSVSKVNPQTVPNQKGLEMASYISDKINFSKDISAEAGLRFNAYAGLGPSKVYTFKNDAPRTVDNIVDTLNYGKNQIVEWYTSLEPRFSFRYSLNKYSSLKLSYDRHSQFINLISNTAVMSPTDVYNLSNPNVKPLINNQVAVGYFRNFADNSVETSAQVYYKKSKNIVEYRNGATILLNNKLDADLLNASGYSYGLELYLKKNTGRLTGWLSYTFSRSFRHTSSPYVDDQINGNKYYPSPYDIPNNLVINASYHLTRRWRLAGVFYYNTGKPVTLPELKYNYGGFQYVYYSDRNKYRLPDYHRLDIAITFDQTLRIKQFWKGSFTLSIMNLYGHKNPYSVFYKSTSQIESKYNQSFNLYKMSIIERPIPTFTYNFSF